MKKWRQIKRKEKRNNYVEYQPIRLEYKINMEDANGGGGKEVVNQNHTLRKVKEIVIALNSTLEGEATGYFLFENFKGMDIKVSKLAEGVPAGGDLDYVDNNTLKRAFSWRRELGD